MFENWVSGDHKLASINLARQDTLCQADGGWPVLTRLVSNLFFQFLDGISGLLLNCIQFIVVFCSIGNYNNTNNNSLGQRFPKFVSRC